MAKFQISRRKFLTASSLGLSGIALSGCDAFDSGLGIGGGLRSFLENANGLTYRAQRFLAGRDALAPEFTEADIRQPQRPNGVTAPDDDTYKGLLANNFADWRLEVTGLVEKPLSLTREQLQN
ncbi:MAG: molybdopterin oxidoreductase, partial [Mesorhizobium sp.]